MRGYESEGLLMLWWTEASDRRGPKGGQSREDITVIDPRERRWKCGQCDEASIQEKEDLDDHPDLSLVFLSSLFVSDYYIYIISTQSSRYLTSGGVKCQPCSQRVLKLTQGSHLYFSGMIPGSALINRGNR